MKKWFALLSILALSACTAAQPCGIPGNAKQQVTSEQPTVATQGTPRTESEQPNQSASSESPAKQTPSSAVTPDQSTPEGAVLLYLGSFADGDMDALWDVITSATVNRIAALGDTCANACTNSQPPEPAANVDQLSLAENGPSSDGRGVSVLVTDPAGSYSFTCVDESGAWHVDPESYSKQ